MTHKPERFAVTLACDAPLADRDRRAVAKAIKAAVEHFRQEVGLTPDDCDASVVEVYSVEPLSEVA